MNSKSAVRTCCPHLPPSLQSQVGMDSTLCKSSSQSPDSAGTPGSPISKATRPTRHDRQPPCKCHQALLSKGLERLQVALKEAPGAFEGPHKPWKALKCPYVPFRALGAFKDPEGPSGSMCLEVCLRLAGMISPYRPSIQFK